MNSSEVRRFSRPSGILLCACRVRASMSALATSCRRPYRSASVSVRSVSSAQTPVSTRPSARANVSDS